MRTTTACLIALLVAPLAAAQDVPTLTARLHAAREAVAPGSSIDLVVELTITPRWHIYHPILLETGFPTTVEFETPAGVTVGELRYPTPTLAKMLGQEYLGYEGRVLLLTTLNVDRSVPVGRPIRIRAAARALACIEQCVPVSAEATLELPVASEPGRPVNEELISAARRGLPPSLAEAPYIKGSELTVSRTRIGMTDKAELIARIRVQPGHHIQDRNPGVEGLIPSRLFVEQIDGLQFADPNDQIWPEPKVRLMPGLGRVREQAGDFTVRIPFQITDEKFPSGPVAVRVLFQYQACTDAGQCYPPQMAEAVVRFTAETPNPTAGPAKAGAPPPATSAAGAAAGGAGGPGGQSTLGVALFFAVLGGLILNITPCVLPVVSIKIVSFVQQAGEDPRRVLRLGLAFAAGVMVWFWVMAAVTGLGSLQLRSQFQNPLQNPTVVFVVGTIIFVMALNLFGVFELNLPGAAAEKLEHAARREGYPGAFAKGFLATLLGTACTAPFLAPALAYAVTQPFLTALAVFSAAGVGMALPYVLLSANPQLLRYLPRPGPWMHTFKQAMGFLLAGTAVWLLWILRKQIGADGVVVTVAFWSFLSLAAWLVGKVRPTWRPSAAVAAWVAAVCIGVFGYRFSFHYLYEPHSVEGETAARIDLRDEAQLHKIAERAAASSWDRIPWIPYQPGLAEALSKLGYTVYVDYTADWCATCKTNLSVVLETSAVRQLMKRLGVVPIEADFTNNDPDMRRDIEADGRLSVPVNRVYLPGHAGQYVLLPVVLTQSAVVEALERAGPSRQAQLAGRAGTAGAATAGDSSE